MGRRKKRVNSITYLIATVLLIILSALGVKFVSFNDTAIVHTVNPENLQNITIKTSEKVTKGFTSNNTSNLKVYFFDVGQADSMLIMNEDQTMMIDAGNNEDGQLLVENLKTLGINKIDYLVGTHPHEDHIGGLDDIINNFEIGTIYMPKVQTNTKTFEDVLDAVSNKNLKITTPKVNDTFLVGNAECTILSIDNNAKELNLSSIVIQMKLDSISYLFTGDAETKVEEKILKNYNTTDREDELKTNILKVGHHGSDTSTSDQFLETIVPEVAIISVGEDNKYKHPSSETIEKLEQIGSEIYRTDEKGNIFIEQRKRTD